MARKQERASVFNIGSVSCVVLLAAPFAFYAITRGGLIADPTEQATSRFFETNATWASSGLYIHMVTGGLVTLLAPLQLLSVVRSKIPVVHRLLGYVVAVLAMLTGIAGLLYIARVGTIGGTWMDMGFGLYGTLMVLFAARTIGLARDKDPKHPVWAVRLIILALASWFYRVHYGIWEIATGGIGTRPDFTGPFDLVQVFAFYVPYLLAFELWRKRTFRAH